MQRFSARLILLRKERRLTQEEMAAAIHKKRSTLSGYETEGKEPDLETICFLAQFFGVSTDYLLGYSDERNHVETVFFNDHVNFEQHFKTMPSELRPTITKCFDSFYLLLNRDMQMGLPERLLVYQELLATLQARRADIRRLIETSEGSVSDPVVLSELMAKQSELKNEISILIDKLMQADMEIAFNLKKSEADALSSGSAM